MDRANVEIAPDGQILVDVSKLYQWPKGQPSAVQRSGSVFADLEICRASLDRQVEDTCPDARSRRGLNA